MSHAVITTKSAPLAYEFGQTLAKKYFGDEALENLPKYVRGAKKGQPKGRIHWRKVERGGWVSEGGYDDRYGMHNGHVETRVGKLISVAIVIQNEDGENVIVSECGDV